MQLQEDASARSTSATIAPLHTSSGVLLSSGTRRVILSLLLALITLILYGSVIHNGFINLDDNGYVTDNKHVKGGLSPAMLRWALTTFECENWHPLTWVSHSLDWQLFGKNAGGHHYISAVFHALNAVLLFLLLESATGFTWRSLMVALLFALHPVNVESVAWVAERKNVLSMVFFLLALMAYGWYAERPSVRRYCSVAFLFALGLMAKPQVITFPFVLLLWDYWPLQRFGSRQTTEDPSRFAPTRVGWLLIEKLPLLLLSAGDALLTMLAQHKAVDSAMTQYPFTARLINALIAYTRYIAHAFWPVGLAPAYPHLGGDTPLRQGLAAGAFLLLITAVILALGKRFLLVGWLWFLGILVPMIGVIQVGDQALADRYAYIPFIGLFWIVVWSIAEFTRERQISWRWLAVPVCLAVVGCSVMTIRQVSYWHDSEALWKYTLSVTDRNFMAHDYLGGILMEENRHEEAIQHFKIAEQLHQYPVTQLVYFADYELRHQHTAAAMADAQRVLQGTNDPVAREVACRDLGIAYTQLGKATEAREYYRQAIEINPRDPYPLMGMGLLAYRESDFQTAADYFSRTIVADPSDFDYLLLAGALQKAGRKAEADAAYAQAQRVSKDWTEAQDKASWFLTN